MARRLAAGGPPEAELAGIAGLLREALAAERVTIWHASEGVPGFRGLSVPEFRAAERTFVASTTVSLPWSRRRMRARWRTPKAGRVAR